MGLFAFRHFSPQPFLSQSLRPAVLLASAIFGREFLNGDGVFSLEIFSKLANFLLEESLEFVYFFRTHLLLLLHLLVKLLNHLLVPLNLSGAVIPSVLEEFALLNKSGVFIEQSD